MFVNKAIIIIIFAILIYALIAIFTDFSKFVDNLQNLNMSYLPIILSFVIFSLMLKSLRQYYLLKKLNIKISWIENIKIYIAGLSMLVTPGGSGELVKSDIIKKRYNESISKTVPVVFIERFHDFLGILGILLITTIFIFTNETILVIIGSSIILLLISIIIVQKKFLKWIQNKFEKIKFLKKLLSRNDEFYDSLNKLFKPQPIFICFLISLASIFLDGIAIYFSIISIIPEFGFVEAIQKGFTSVIIGLFSLLPAGIGVTEVSLLGMLSNENISGAQAASAVIYVRLTTLWFMTGLGFIFLKIIYKK